MQAARIPANEDERLAALHSYELLDTPAEATFDDITRLASYICGTPISVMTLVDADRQWLKSKVGLDASETPREQAFCAHTILGSEPLIVRDALADARFVDNPLVTGAPNIRFYAGVPLVTPDGYALGALCAIDRVPRDLDAAQLEAMSALADQVVQNMELRRSLLQLQKQALRLARVNEGKDQLFAMISHDLRSPMVGVLGMLELLAEESHKMSTKEVQHYLSVLAESTRQTFSLLESLLQWSLFESGQMSFHPQALLLDHIIADVLALTGVAAKKKSITLEATTHPHCKVQADPAMLRSVIQNLVANALKFTNAGGTVTVRSVVRGDRVEVAVEDTGIGVAPVVLAKLVEGSGHSTPGTGGERGSGLGLRICRQFVEKQGGIFTARSESGKGTTFTFTLPLAN